MKRLLLVLLAACAGSGYEPLDNRTFSLWRGNELLGWEVVRGEVRRAPTWHPNDYGVELVGGDVKLAQTTEVDEPCMTVSVIADAADASVSFGIDYGADDSVEITQLVPESSWAPLTFRITGPVGPLRLSIEKHGEGRAVLANLRLMACK